jgi:hypothetical protein
MINAFPNIGTQFVWWVGVVEDRQDPKKVGRCRVRIIGAHTPNKADLPTNQLPWAQPMMSLNDTSSPQLKEGDYVVGFYFDGQDCQVPVIMGTIPGIPVEQRGASEGFSDPRTASQLSQAPKSPESVTVAGGSVSIRNGSGKRNPKRLNESALSRLARNEKITNTPIQLKKTSTTKAVPKAGNGTWSEPSTPYNATYPYNRVMETESGHILEFDDTPGAERVHIYHRSGTFEEIHPDGTKVTRIHASAYEIVLSDKNVYIKGDVNITAGGDLNLKAGGSVNIEAGQEIVLNGTTAIKTQALTQSHMATGPMSINGLPLNLNGPPTTIIPPALPVAVVTAGTFSEG